MPVRTFTVYQDASPVKKSPTIRPLGRSASAAAVLTTSSRCSENHTTVSLPEKENLHPLTGTRLGNGANPSMKKRKASESSSVLAPKVLGVASEASGSVKSKPKRTELKRKASSQTSSGKAKFKKENTKKDGETARKALSELGTTRSVSSTSKPVSRAGSRSVSAPVLATIKEEVATQITDEDESESVAKSITQALIDSRCYELTVSPLADVSHAYLQSSKSKEDSKIKEPAELHKEEPDFAKQIRDYFLFEGSRLDSQPSTGTLTSLPTPLFSEEFDVFKSFDFVGFSSNAGAGTPKSAPSTPKKSRVLARSHSAPTTPTKGSTKKSADAGTAIAPIMISTPERKELYATFTFTTPKSSPTEVL